MNICHSFNSANHVSFFPKLKSPFLLLFKQPGLNMAAKYPNVCMHSKTIILDC